ALPCPLDLAGVPVGAVGPAGVGGGGEDEVADDGGAAVLVPQRGPGVLFRAVDAAALAGERQQRPALAVAGAGEDVVADGDRRGDVGGVVAQALVLPEELAVLGADADRPRGGEVDVLLDV